MRNNIKSWSHCSSNINGNQSVSYTLCDTWYSKLFGMRREFNFEKRGDDCDSDWYDMFTGKVVSFEDYVLIFEIQMTSNK